MRELLVLLRKHEELIEADLLRYYGVDYLDRWRLNEHGRPRLTLRRILVLIKALPHDSQLAQQVHGPAAVRWGVADHLLDDLRMAVERIAGVKKPKRHSSRPKPAKPRAAVSPDRRRKLLEGRRRLRERARQIEEGVIE